MKSAWLIGAGFSYELAMPLVSELTGEIKAWLTSQHLRELNAGWHEQRAGIPDSIIEALDERLRRENLHYEQLIEWLQSEEFRGGVDRLHYRFLIGKLQAAVTMILLQRHVRNPNYHRHALPWYRGLIHAVPRTEPLWVFSLNHDLCVEMLGADLGIPVSCGFSEVEAVHFTTDDGIEVRFDRIRRELLTSGQLVFSTSCGINLVKLHGSLDVFAYNDRKDYLRIHPTDTSSDGWVHAVESVEKLPATYEGERILLDGEICVIDQDGELQFLRRTVVAGGFKFDPRADYNAPGELVEYFARMLENFDELVVIGYSWCDQHLNTPIEHWLAGTSSRRIINIDPKGLPAHMNHIRTCVDEKEKMAAAEFIATFSLDSVSRKQELERELGLLQRRLNDQSKCQEAMRRVKAEFEEKARSWIVAQGFTGDEDPSQVLAIAPDDLRMDELRYMELVIRELRSMLR